ncbi:arabinofuranosyltransferase [Amycolatopsis sp.]|uniref:arabinofuranosyltransferase n=1 Tax=Amycolatopsis sp. TaxID=37632 RepID=UPI002D08BFDD|nr:arabinofuranosyltransferase [Amycolatopsis sp.]HVV12240.1 arabinofuranosyltransferase [Amycolatopsis sp.]
MPHRLELVLTAQLNRPAVAPPETGPAMGRWAGGLVAGTAVAAVVSLVVQFAVNRLHIDPGTYVPQALMALASTVVVVVVFALLAWRKGLRLPGWLKAAATWTALSGLATLMIALPLQGTKYFLNGASVDNPFRLQFMERMTAGPGLADMNYTGMPTYYPAGWFWLGGRFAGLAHLEGWVAYKPYSIMWVAITPVVAYALWSLVAKRRMALLLAVATIFTGFISQGLEEPYSWPASAWLPPVAVLTWLTLRAPGRVRFGPLAVIGGYLGFTAMTYTLYFFFGVFVVVVLAIVAGVTGARRGEKVIAPLVRRLAVAAAVAVPLALVTWGPFLLAGGLGETNTAAHHLPGLSAAFPFPFSTASVFAVLCFAGVVWLLLRARQNPIAFALLTITALVYVWYALSTLALAAHTTLLAFRVIIPLDVTLAVAGVFAAVELLRLVPRQLPTAGLVLACAAAVALAQISVSDGVREGIQTAESDSYPTGFNARGQHDAAEDRGWSGQLIATINQLSGRPPEGDVVLSANGYLLSYQAYWGYQHTSAQYANPLAEYNTRNEDIRYWASSASSGELLARLAANPRTPPNVFVLRNHGGTLTMGVVTDVFPRTPDIRVDDVPFAPALFDSPRFVRQVVGPFTVIVGR